MAVVTAVDVITGINGALGISTALKLFKKKYSVVGFGRRAKKFPPILELIEYVEGDLLDKNLLKRALNGVDVIMHFAAHTIFKSRLSDHVQSNILGIATLLDVIIEENFPIKKIIFASSGAVYGEGAYKCLEHGVVYPEMRGLEQLKKKIWEPLCPACGEQVTSIATAEDKNLSGSHIYSISKQVGEKMFSNFSQYYSVPFISLRYPVLYGVNQQKGFVLKFLDNIFQSKTIFLNEDGKQLRDYLFYEDAVDSAIFALEHIESSGIFNIAGFGPVTLIDVTKAIGEIVKKTPTVIINQEFRLGDIRHIYLDDSKIRKLGFEPNINLNDGLKALVKWKKY